MLPSAQTAPNTDAEAGVIAEVRHRLPWWARWARNALIAGLIVSGALHLLGGVVATLIYIAGPGGGGSPGDEGGGGGGVEMALMTEGELSAMGGGGLEESTGPAGQATPTDTLSVDDKLSGPPGDTATGAGEGSDLHGGLGGAGDVSGGKGVGGGPGGAGGGGGTSFFGLEAKGDRIAFIVDTSGSMIGDRLQELKSQLTSAVNEMAETSSFVIINFSTDADVLGGKLEWTDATAKGKLWATRLIDGLVADGGTRPRPGFEQLWRIRPKADAIFFMTDGVFEERGGDDEMVSYLVRNNKGPRAKIHCICFEENGSEPRMKEIARNSGGSYTFVGRKPR